MDLFDRQGYAATTVEQIAAAAEVSPSTFFRYYPTKEDVVLTDEYDPALVAAIRRQPAGVHPVDAFVAAMREVFGGLSVAEVEAEVRRHRLFEEVPEIRARYMHQAATGIDMLAEVFAAREGRPANDPAAKVVAGAIVGCILAMTPRDGSYGMYNLDEVTGALTLMRRELGGSGPR